jgi:electron transport complex protein RnfG
MKESLKITGVLTVVCVICAFLLAYVDSLASKEIAMNAQKRIQDSINILAPLAQTIKEIKTNEDEVIYKLFDKNDKALGYAFIASGQGYQGTVKMLAVINPDLSRLEGIEVIESVETPGLGAKIQENPFREQFKNLSVGEPIECTKEEPVKDNQIKAITGATVSSRAVVNILNKRIEELKGELSAN